MIITNKELEQKLKKYGRQYTITEYINRKFNMTQKQLDYVLNYKDKR